MVDIEGIGSGAWFRCPTIVLPCPTYELSPSLGLFFRFRSA